MKFSKSNREMTCQKVDTLVCAKLTTDIIILYRVQISMSFLIQRKLTNKQPKTNPFRECTVSKQHQHEIQPAEGYRQSPFGPQE